MDKAQALRKLRCMIRCSIWLLQECALGSNDEMIVTRHNHFFFLFCFVWYVKENFEGIECNYYFRFIKHSSPSRISFIFQPPLPNSTTSFIIKGRQTNIKIQGEQSIFYITILVAMSELGHKAFSLPQRSNDFLNSNDNCSGQNKIKTTAVERRWTNNTSIGVGTRQVQSPALFGGGESSSEPRWILPPLKGKGGDRFSMTF